jgi:hypothetical protein
MAICPACQTEQKKREAGVCPNCRVKIEIHGGRWFRAGMGSPNAALLEQFEKRVSESLSAGREVPVIYRIPRKGVRFRRELAVAERLIEAADYDYTLAVETLDVLFADRRFNWKTRDSLLWIERDYNLALAIARSNREAARLQLEKEQKAVKGILKKENLFE